MPATTLTLPEPRTFLRTGRGQVLLFLCTYFVYSMSRYVAVGDLSVATDHARWIVDLENAIVPDVEISVQDFFQGSAVLWLLNHVYLAAQLVVVPGALIWLYRRGSSAYVALRNTVLATWLIALPIYACFPVAPPRLADIGLIDTITSQAGLALDSKLTTSFYNPLAAVPSLHAGFALAVTLALASAARTRWTKPLALSWAPLVSLSVVATGNHFIFDILAGFLVTGLGYAAGRVVQRAVDRRRAVA
jgi:membrane-associated phospholipid phosphatase